jgi:DNA-binding transcriptional MerR regulator
MQKSAEAFRTISEVADSVELPQHVLRFWETRFPQIRPLKRAGGRRYYRPDDVERLRLIKRLLYDEGYTIKGVQKLFKEQGLQALTSGALEPRIALAAAELLAHETGEVGEGAPDGLRPPPDEAGRSIAEVEPPLELGGGGRSPEDLAALRGALAEITEAARILNQARTRET